MVKDNTYFLESVLELLVWLGLEYHGRIGPTWKSLAVYIKSGRLRKRGGLWTNELWRGILHEGKKHEVYLSRWSASLSCSLIGILRLESHCIQSDT